MKFFLPDSHDMVDPSFDFVTETRAEFRVIQRDDLYAHEMFQSIPFHGVLVSMGSIGGAGTGRYTLAQRYRLRRLGVREFFRIPETSRLETMGDCGAFSYVMEKEPPISTSEVVTFYNDCGFDFGISVDHIIVGFKPEYDKKDDVPEDWKNRHDITLQRAKEFLKLCNNVSFEPIAVAHGWSPRSYAIAFKELQEEGFQTIAIGGLVRLKTTDIMSILESVSEFRKQGTEIHLLGVSRVDHVNDFSNLGVKSFDSTSPLRQAFKDERDNYYTQDRAYSAIRIPQVKANLKLKKRIAQGEVDGLEALRHERSCRDSIARYDIGKESLSEVLKHLKKYEDIYDGKKTRIERYREVLTEKPWKKCKCDICKKLQHHVILFRGSERNRRRGFHNVYVVNERIKQELNKNQ